MKARNVIDLLTLSTNLYMISKDKEMIDSLKKMFDKGKNKVNDFMEDVSDEEEDEETFLHKLIIKADKAKEELEKQMEEVAVKMYRKMRIAHTDEIKFLTEQIDNLKKDIGLAEAKIKELESKIVKS